MSQSGLWPVMCRSQGGGYLSSQPTISLVPVQLGRLPVELGTVALGAGGRVGAACELYVLGVVRDAEPVEGVCELPPPSAVAIPAAAAVKTPISARAAALLFQYVSVIVFNQHLRVVAVLSKSARPAHGHVSGGAGQAEHQGSRTRSAELTGSLVALLRQLIRHPGPLPEQPAFATTVTMELAVLQVGVDEVALGPIPVRGHPRAASEVAVVHRRRERPQRRHCRVRLHR